MLYCILIVFSCLRICTCFSVLVFSFYLFFIVLIAGDSALVLELVVLLVIIVIVIIIAVVIIIIILNLLIFVVVVLRLYSYFNAVCFLYVQHFVAPMVVLKCYINKVELSYTPISL